MRHIRSLLVFACVIAATPASAEFVGAAYGGVRAPKWFELPPLDRAIIVSSIAVASDTNFLDVFSCITLFARDPAYREASLDTLIWLCSPPPIGKP